MKTFRLITSGLIVLALVGMSRSETLSHDLTQLTVQIEPRVKLDYPGYFVVAVAPGLDLPARHLYLPLSPVEGTNAIAAISLSPSDLNMVLSPEDLLDATTSSENGYATVEAGRNFADRLGSQPMAILGERMSGGHRYYEFLLFPVTVDASGRLWFHPTVEITIAGRAVAASELVSSIDDTRRSRSEGLSSQGPDYLIVTSGLLAEALRPLAAYKNETGYRAEIGLIEDILSQHSGRDNAEKLREHLKQFYADGGRYVLLAGDETVLPIRYAYPNNVSSLPPLDQLQVCDLYFADLTGDWDADGDGVWGEKYGDGVDVVPELLLGRLPINTPEEAFRYVAKLIKYETDPGDGDRSYLERAFFFSSDQMRDYAEAGQHGVIAEAYPDWFEIDTVSGVEQSSGDDPAPTNPNPADLSPAFEGGCGIVNIVAHGRSDGFVLKSSGYNEWPKIYVLTDNGESQHSLLPGLDSIKQAGFYYSLACNNGGFDMDQPPLNEANPSLVQQLIGSAGGAVGMVAYSRWGWISSSYLLQQAFFDSLFAHPERTAVEALYTSKQVFYYYRDLVYGLNYYGDPTLRVYASLPAKPELSLSPAEYGLQATVSIDGQVASLCEILLSQNGQVLSKYTTDMNGRAMVNYHFEGTALYRLSVILPGASITQVNFIPSLVTDVDDDAALSLPTQYALHQNYPNPFNPSTIIAFDLPVRSDVSLQIYNLLGQAVAKLLDGSVEAGNHSVTWNGTTELGETTGSGVYFYRLEAGNKVFTKKMILLK